GEHVEHGTQIVRRHPSVRHVADELWRPGVAPNDLRPFAPLRRTLTGEEEVQQLVRALGLTEADEGADGAELVGRVVLPFLHSDRSGMRFGEIAIERGCNGALG